MKKKRQRSHQQNHSTYSQLESRNLLAAVFAYDSASSELTLNQFNVGSDLSIDQANVSINGGPVEGAYIFTLTSGTWSGAGLPSSEFENVGRELRVATSLFGGALSADVVIDGSGQIGLTQANPANDIEFESLSISNIRNIDTDMELNVVGDVSLDDILSFRFSSSTAAAEISVTTQGSIDVVGRIGNLIDDPDAAVVLNAGGLDSDIVVDAAISTEEGDILLEADDEVQFLASASLTARDTGDVTVAANADASDGNHSDGIVMAEGSFIDAGTGEIVLSSFGSHGGNVEISSIRTNNSTSTAIFIDSNRGVIDGSGSTNIVANSIGAVVTIDAHTGVGSGNPLEIQVSYIDVDNTTSGNIELIQEAAGGGINVLHLDNDGAVGTIELLAEDGTITVEAAGDGVESTGGGVTFDAQGDVGSVVIDNTVTTIGGNVDIDAVVDVEVGIVVAAAGDVDIDGGNDVEVSGIDAGNASIIATGDIAAKDVTVASNLFIAAGTNGVGAGQLELDGDLTTTSALGQILLQSSGGIEQLSGTITTSNLLLGGNATLESSGTFDLTGSNSVDRLAVDLRGALSFENSLDLEIADLSFASALGKVEAIAKAVIRSSLEFDIDGEINQTAPISATGVTVIDATEVNLTDADNDFNELGEIFGSGGTVNIVDVNNLVVNDIVATTAFFTSAGALTLSDASPAATNLSLLAGGTLTLPPSLSVTGDLSIEGANVAASDGFIDLSANRVMVEVVGANSLVVDGITASTYVDLAANGNITVGDVVVDWGDITIGSRVLTAGNLEGNNVTVTSSSNTNIDSVVADGVASLTSARFMTVPTVDADSATLIATRSITFDRVRTVGDATLTAGTGNLTGERVDSSSGAIELSSQSSVNVGVAFGTGDVTVHSGNQVNARLLRSRSGSVTVDSVANLSSRFVEAGVDVTLTAPNSNFFSDSVIAGGSAQLTTGAFLFALSIEATHVQTNAGTNQTVQRLIADTADINSVEDIRMNDVQVGQLTMDAGDDIFDARFGDGIGIVTDSLVVTAGNSNDLGGIVLETNVNFFSATLGSNLVGNVIVREVDDVVLGDILVGDGRVVVQAEGTISEGNIRTRVQNDRNDVRLITGGAGSDIRVDQIDVGNTGDVFLIADDDVIIDGVGDQVKADFLFVSARNQSAGGTDGIALSSNAVTGQFIVGNRNDSNQNRGDISVTEANALNVDFARTLVGKIDVTTNGSLVARNIRSEGVNESDAIRLTALGFGSDVVTSSVSVLNRAGGIVIAADDDIRDSNVQDNLEVTSDSLTLVAGNNRDDAFNGISSQSRVISIDAMVNSAIGGDTILSLVNTGTVTVNQAIAVLGQVRITNRTGPLTINDVNISSSSANNRVFLTTEASSDILIGRVDSGNGRVTINSGDDIFDFDLLDDLFIEGAFLSATSLNGSDNTTDGIILTVDVDNFVIDAQGGGVEIIHER